MYNLPFFNFSLPLNKKKTVIKPKIIETYNFLLLYGNNDNLIQFHYNLIIKINFKFKN